MVTRRKYLAAVSGGVATVSIAGCGLLSDTVEASASPGAVPESVRGSTGFADEQMEKTTFEDTREVAGEERELKLTNWTTEYTKAPAREDVGAAGFVIFSSPTVSIADRSFNPFDRLDEKQLIRRVLSRSGQGEAGDIQEAGSESFSVLENSVEFSEYESTQSVAGADVDIRIHFGNFTHDGDLLAILGTYPEVLSDLENVRKMAEGTDPPVDTP